MQQAQGLPEENSENLSQNKVERSGNGTHWQNTCLAHMKTQIESPV